ncbi:RDD family protein [Cellulomonas sp. APG4]|uniref:RDD family protein n=1 Tax=Cellulomonas sp. APG4 TaxID=1538656 RepID=UPI001379939B|nr:RDD family protein [Cellulomonas sp. APG4]
MIDDDGGAPVRTAVRTAPLAPRPASLASWTQRVVASVLDNLLLGGVVFLAVPVQPTAAPDMLGPGLPADGSVVWNDPWVLSVFAAMLVMQAYLGSSPGKLLLGIAVVDADRGRPVGLLRTLARWVLHVLDAILLVGFLRPLWHPWRQTFADSLVSTVALSTRSPLPHRGLERLVSRRRGTQAVPAHPVATQADLAPEVELRRRPRPAPGAVLRNVDDRSPRWRRLTTLGSAVVVTAGAAFAIGPTTGTSAPQTYSWCEVADPPDAPLRLVHGSVSTWPEPWTESRWGVERVRLTDQPRGLHVAWGWDGEVPQEDVVMRLRLRDADGGTRTIDHVSRGGQIQDGLGTPVGDTSTEVLLPLSVLDDVGEEWGWELSMVVDGEELPGCGASAPPPA